MKLLWCSRVGDGPLREGGGLEKHVWMSNMRKGEIISIRRQGKPTIALYCERRGLIDLWRDSYRNRGFKDDGTEEDKIARTRISRRALGTLCGVISISAAYRHSIMSRAAKGIFEWYVIWEESLKIEGYFWDGFKERTNTAVCTLYIKTLTEGWVEAFRIKMENGLVKHDKTLVGGQSIWFVRRWRSKGCYDTAQLQFARFTDCM